MTETNRAVFVAVWLITKRNGKGRKKEEKIVIGNNGVKMGTKNLRV